MAERGCFLAPGLLRARVRAVAGRGVSWAQAGRRMARGFSA